MKLNSWLFLVWHFQKLLVLSVWHTYMFGGGSPARDECLCYFETVLLADEVLGMSSLKALGNSAWCNSLAIKSMNVLSKGRTVTATLVGRPCLLIISRVYCFGVCCPDSRTSAQPPPPISGCAGQRCCSSARLSSQGQLPRTAPQQDRQWERPQNPCRQTEVN